MKSKKPKFVQIVRGVAGGCNNQISRKQHYQLNPMSVMGKKGYVPEIWTLKKEGKEREDLFEGVRVRRFSNTLSLLLNLFLDRDTKLVYSQLRPYLPSLLAPLSMKKCILMTQTYEFGNWLTKRFSLFFMKKFERVFALTPYERGSYIKMGLKEERVVFMPHAIDYSFFSKRPEKSLAEIRKKYGINEGDFVVTTVANFRKFKNIDIMVGAFALLNKKVKNSKMLVVGIDQTKNPFYTEQRSKRYSEVQDVDDVIKKEGISQNVIFTGGVGHREVREILYITDVFVNSSDPEGMGMAVYEAASSGVPLCLSDIGSFTSVFKDMALYSAPRDKEKLGGNYLRYYEDISLRKKMGEKLRGYLKKWDYPVIIDKFNKIFSEVLG